LLRGARAAGEACESIYVQLFAFVKTTPDDYDFPLTRQALKGHKDLAGATFVVTRDRGNKYFGAFVPDLALARKLAGVVQKGVKDASPEILCAQPEKVRDLAIDFETGDVKR
jgi:hypothetical protein